MRQTLSLRVPALAAGGKSKQQPQASAPPPPQATIAKPVSKMIADQDEYVGRFVAVEAGEGRARLPGHLESIHCRGGRIAKAGARPRPTDRRPFQSALRQTQPRLTHA